MVSFRNSEGEAARGTLLKLDRSTAVFEVYNPYSIVQLSEVLQDVTIRRGERVIYNGHAVVSNLVNTGLMLIVSVALTDPWKDLTGILSSQLAIREEARRFVSDWERLNTVRLGYQLVVGEIQSFFSDLSRWLQQLDIRSEETHLNTQDPIDDASFRELFDPIAGQTQELFQRFEAEAEEIPGEEIVQHKAYCQRCLHPLIMRAPFPYRAYFKPLGYAGDYETVNMMLRDPRTGPSIYAEVINCIYLSTGPAQAHRNRIQILVDLLVQAAWRAAASDRQFRVLNIGCGPAVELQRFLTENEIDNCYFKLIDFNRDTLDYTRSKMDTLLAGDDRRIELEYVQLSVHSLLKRATEKRLQSEDADYDLVYCAGLFDYLSDRVCSRLLKLFHRWLRSDGGLVVATNVHPRNSSAHMMEHLLEWYLIYRDESDMRRLAPGVGKQRAYVDETGINVFLEIEDTS
jgi:extracellular factor (EF) 3-hydroxypalmitic acid methyl ester biosynthesis protein